MSLTVPPRTYFILDRATKLLALVLITLALAPSFEPRYSIALGLLGVFCALVTVYIQPSDDQDRNS